MIQIVQGEPGSGKSYFAVHYLASLATYEKLYNEWVWKEGVLVITNIEGFKPKHRNLNSEIEKAGGLENYFNIENFEKHYIEKFGAKHVVLIIDEAQRVFDSKYYDKDVFYFFQYHRHLGLDIFLLTQSASTLPRHLIPLCEFLVKAVQRSKSIMRTNRYKFTDTKGNYMYSKVVQKKDEIYGMYNAQRVDESMKPRNVAMQWIITSVVAIVLMFFAAKAMLMVFKNGGKLKAAPVHHQANPIQKPISSVRPVPVVPAPKVVAAVKKKSSSGLRIAPQATVKALPPPLLSRPVPVASPAPSKDEWKKVKITAYVDSATRPSLFIGEQRISEYRNFQVDAMTAEIPAQN